MGVAPASHKNDNVIWLQSQFLLQLQIPLVTQQCLHQYAHALLDEIIPCDNLQLLAMQQGANLILVEGEVREGYNHATVVQKVWHALAVFSIFYCFAKMALDWCSPFQVSHKSAINACIYAGRREEEEFQLQAVFIDIFALHIGQVVEKM